MTHKIKTFNAISAHGLSRFGKEGYEIGGDVADPDAILVRSADLHNAEIPESVQSIARAGAGTNNIPIADCSDRGIVVFNTPGANANAVKELVILGMLMAARNIAPAMAFSRNLSGDDAEFNVAVEKGKKQFVGWELPGRTLGVVGLGSIGVEVANAAAALNMRVLGYDPLITVQHAWHLSRKVERAASIEEVFKKADVISVHVPLNDSTRGLVNADRIALMKQRAVLLNFSRGPIVDTDALLAALNDGKIRGYVCDFPSPALQNHPKVIATPHLGASTGEAEENCAVMAVEQTKDFLENGNIHNSVNFPEAQLPRVEGTARLVVANRNVPNVVAALSTLIGEAGLNISDLLNKSRGDLAWTMIDLDPNGGIPDSLLGDVLALEGVLAARILPPATAA